MPKSWTQKVRRDRKKRKRFVTVKLALEEEDLRFQFHQQWGHMTNEDMLSQLVQYYSLPAVSLRNVIWHQMKANKTFHGLTLRQLYYDRIHPSDFGHTILAQGLVHLFKRSLLFYRAQILTQASSCAHTTPLIPPMQPEVLIRESQALECYDAAMVRQLIEPGSCTGWQAMLLSR